jgi:hypothetical protein
MKTIKLSIIALLFFAGSTAKAQVSINVNIGTPPPPVVVVESPKVVIASPPEWGPVGYDNVEYYFLPDIQVYFDIRLSQYIYFGNGKWIRSRYLPSHCRNYDLYHGYKVVLTDYHGHTPYTYYNAHKVKYYKGYKGAPQQCRGEYKVHYDNGNHKQGNHNDYSHHDNDHHDNHGGNGHHGNGKGGKH